MPNSTLDKEVPYLHLKSPLHQRIPIPPKDKEERMQCYLNSDPILKYVQAIVSRLLKWTKILRGNRIWVFYRVIMGIFSRFYQLIHRMEIHGMENIPHQGALFVINHVQHTDVVIAFMAAFRKPIGIFTDMGDNYFADILEKIGFVPRVGTSEILVEKMIRVVTTKNRYFAMWPEGTPERGNGIMQGFSGIAKVYACINAKKNRIPFVPVTMQEIFPIYRKKQHHPTKLVFHILKPVFIPQDWLRSPNDGGKTAREIIDYIMLIIARKFGQKQLSKNPLLQHRKHGAIHPWHAKD